MTQVGAIYTCRPIPGHMKLLLMIISTNNTTARGRDNIAATKVSLVCRHASSKELYVICLMRPIREATHTARCKPPWRSVGLEG